MLSPHCKEKIIIVTCIAVGTSIDHVTRSCKLASNQDEIKQISQFWFAFWFDGTLWISDVSSLNMPQIKHSFVNWRRDQSWLPCILKWQGYLSLMQTESVQVTKIAGKVFWGRSPEILIEINNSVAMASEDIISIPSNPNDARWENWLIMPFCMQERVTWAYRIDRTQDFS